MDDPAEVPRRYASQANLVVVRLLGGQRRTDVAHGGGEAPAPVLIEGHEQSVHLRARSGLQFDERRSARFGQ